MSINDAEAGLTQRLRARADAAEALLSEWTRRWGSIEHAEKMAARVKELDEVNEAQHKAIVAVVEREIKQADRVKELEAEIENWRYRADKADAENESLDERVTELETTLGRAELQVKDWVRWLEESHRKNQSLLEKLLDEAAENARLREALETILKCGCGCTCDANSSGIARTALQTRQDKHTPGVYLPGCGCNDCYSAKFPASTEAIQETQDGLGPEGSRTSGGSDLNGVKIPGAHALPTQTAAEEPKQGGWVSGEWEHLEKEKARMLAAQAPTGTEAFKTWAQWTYGTSLPKLDHAGSMSIDIRDLEAAFEAGAKAQFAFDDKVYKEVTSPAPTVREEWTERHFDCGFDGTKWTCGPKCLAAQTRPACEHKWEPGPRICFKCSQLEPVRGHTE